MRSTKSIVTLSLFTLFFSPLQSFAGDPEMGKLKSSSCVFCHGTNSDAETTYPSLLGKDAQALIDAMEEYKNGDRKGAMADMMRAQLQHLDSNDIADIAAFYTELN
ncbi:c-type cytochrome [Vibrio nigripulchritudo]|uniref:c-type cytochrome n=1 Tax=Vibrio nigripulchritudo TaxID=28173 RepID=UPI00308486DA|nr:cytochrome c554 [Vibrio nigripulchritudo]BDU45660.1 cytochrome c554 [Vibrio nigripulchritudo]